MNQRVFRPGVLAVSVIALCLVMPGAASGAAPVEPATPAPTTMTKDKPFAAVANGPATVSPGETFQLRYSVYPLNHDHYLYKERMGLKVPTVAGISFSPIQFSPDPEKKYDQFEARDMEIYHVPVTLYVEGKVAPDAAPGSRTVEVQLSYQGCNPTVCFFPTRQTFPLTFEIVKKSAMAPTPGAGEGSSVAAASDRPIFGTAGGANDATQVMDAAEGEPDPVAAAPMANEGAAVPAPPLAPTASAIAAEKVASSGTVSSSEIDVASFRKHGLLWTFLAVFGLGFMASFTPCIYPLIPITLSVLGARDSRSRFHGFTLALVYVLGLSITYTALGMFAALTGALFGAWMQSPWVVGSVAGLFIFMGFGMLGAFNVTMPSGFTTRLSQVHGRGYPGAFVTGGIAGLVASPCVGPLIVSLLTYIAQTRDVMLGAALMFTFAFGMGQLFLALGTFAVVLPRSGAWMEQVKGALALVLFGVGLYYLRTVVPEGYYELLLGISALVAGTFVGAFHVLNEESSVGARLQKSAGILFVVVGLYSIIGGLLGTQLIAPQVAQLLNRRGGEAPVQTAGIVWETDFSAAMDRAKNEGAPVLLDFTAEWCAACKELEHKTYTDTRVMSAAREFVRIKLDGTEGTPEFETLKNRYQVKGLPSVLFLSPDGTPDSSLTVTGFVPPEDFLARMCRVEGPQLVRMTDVCRG